MPIILVIVAGYFLRQKGFLDDNTTNALDKFSFQVALPLMLFIDIAQMDFYSEFRLDFVIFCIAATTISFLVVWFLAEKFMSDRRMVGSFVQGSVRGSVAILGVSVITNVYGSAGIAAIVVAVVAPLYNVLSIFALTFCASDGKIDAARVKKSLKEIVTNPLVIGIFLGMPFALLRLEIPSAIAGAISNIGKTATPLALIVVGASFNLADATKRLRPALLASIIKLIILPAVFLPIAVMLGYRDATLMSALMMLGSATAPASYIMSKNFGCDAPLSANIVIIAEGLFAVTITAWLYILKALALI